MKFVTADRGWTDNPSELLYYRVVHTMDDELHDATEIAELVGSEGRDVGQVFELLVQQGLAGAFPRRLSDSYTHDAGLKATGKAKKSEWIAAQTPGRTKRACVAALLSWFDARDGETISSTDDFAGDVRAYYFGIPFESSTIVAAAKELKNLDLIKGTGTWGGPVMRPAITTLGKVVVARHGGDLIDWQAATQGNGGISIHNSTGVAVANNSSNASQSITVTTNVADQVLNLAAALQAMIPVLELEPAQEASAHGLVVQLQQSAPESESSPRKVKQLVSAVRDIAVNAAGGAAGSALVALAEQVASNL
ncbi:MAG: hypothetical protein WBQ50_02670 [Nocardioides sp.]